MARLFYYGWTRKNELLVTSSLESIAPICHSVATLRAASLAQARRLAAARGRGQGKTNEPPRSR